MKLLDLIKQRYSCRDYQEKSVEQEKLDYVMECVRLAPSAVNKQPWKFHMVLQARVVCHRSYVYHLQHPAR